MQVSGGLNVPGSLARRRRIFPIPLLQLCPVDASCLHPASLKPLSCMRPALYDKSLENTACGAPQVQGMPHLWSMQACWEAQQGLALDPDIRGLHGRHINGGDVQHTCAGNPEGSANTRTSGPFLKPCAGVVTYSRLLADRTQQLSFSAAPAWILPSWVPAVK